MRTKVLLPIILILLGALLFSVLRLVHLQSENAALHLSLENEKGPAAIERPESPRTRNESPLAQLSQEQEHLRILGQELEHLRTQTQLLARLMLDKKTLSEEVENLRALLPMQTNKIVTSPTPLPGSVSYQENLDALICANHLLQIGIAIRYWGATHDGYGPSSLLELQDLVAPMILVCPASKPTSMDVLWRSGSPRDSVFDPATISYRLISPRAYNLDTPGLPLEGATRRMVVCPIHQMHIDTYGGLSWPSKYLTRWTSRAE